MGMQTPASETVSLVFIDDVSADKSSRISLNLLRFGQMLQNQSASTSQSKCIQMDSSSRSTAKKLDVHQQPGQADAGDKTEGRESHEQTQWDWKQLQYRGKWPEMRPQM